MFKTKVTALIEYVYLVILHVVCATLKICIWYCWSTEKRTPNSDLQRMTEEASKKLYFRSEFGRVSRYEPGEHRDETDMWQRQKLCHIMT